MVFSFFRRGRDAASTEDPTNPVEEIHALVARGRKIQAIKVLRGVTGWGLHEAKDVVDRVGRGEAVPELSEIATGEPTPSPGFPPSVPPEGVVPPASAREIRDLALAGKKIQAVKEVRAATGWGLKEAKEAVDRVETGQHVPELDGVVPDEPLTAANDPAVPAELAHQVRELTLAGNKVQAITVLRAATGWGLHETKAVVDRVESGDHMPEFDGDSTDVASAHFRSVVPPEVGDHVRELASVGRYVDAITLLHEAVGWGVNDAKGVVERLAAGDEVPELVRASVAARARATLAEIGPGDAIAQVARETGLTPEEAARFVDTLG